MKKNRDYCEKNLHRLNSHKIVKIMKPFYFLFMLTFFLLMANVSYAQQRQVTGTVTDEATGEPLIGVTIVLKGTTVGAITDLSGGYSISVSGDEATLQFSSVGYVTQEIVVGQNTGGSTCAITTGGGIVMPQSTWVATQYHTIKFTRLGGVWYQTARSTG